MDLAIECGHHDLVLALVDIAEAQYAPPEKVWSAPCLEPWWEGKRAQRRAGAISFCCPPHGREVEPKKRPALAPPKGDIKADINARLKSINNFDLAAAHASGYSARDVGR